MISEIVQNSQISYSFIFNDFILVHEYIHSCSTTTLLLNNMYTNSHSTTHFSVKNIFIRTMRIMIPWPDLSKAFDTVSHSCLLHKLPSCGINNKELHWFTDYLFSRT